MRRELKRFAAGEDVDPIRFRPGDYWPDVAEYVSGLMERVRTAEKRAEEMAERLAPPILSDTGSDAHCEEVLAGI